MEFNLLMLLSLNVVKHLELHFVPFFFFFNKHHNKKWINSKYKCANVGIPQGRRLQVLRTATHAGGTIKVTFERGISSRQQATD